MYQDPYLSAGTGMYPGKCPGTYAHAKNVVLMGVGTTKALTVVIYWQQQSTDSSYYDWSWQKTLLKYD